MNTTNHFNGSKRSSLPAASARGASSLLNVYDVLTLDDVERHRFETKQKQALHKQTQKNYKEYLNNQMKDRREREQAERMNNQNQEQWILNRDQQRFQQARDAVSQRRHMTTVNM
jgi:recombinational DNA repair protein (RecF pathway)